MLPPPPVLAPPDGMPAGTGGVLGVGLAEPSGVGAKVLGVTAGTGRAGGLDDTGADGPGRGVQVHVGVGAGGGVKQRHVGTGAGVGV
jgi:hypothetical protein